MPRGQAPVPKPRYTPSRGPSKRGRPVRPKTPANIPRAPRTPANKPTPPPKIDVVDYPNRPANLGIGLISRLGTFVTAALTPTPVADATVKIWVDPGFDKAPADVKRMAVGAIAEPSPEYPTTNYEKIPSYTTPELPEVPWKEFTPDIGPAYTKSPKKGTVIVNVPDVKVPQPIRVDPDPEHDIWQIPEGYPVPEYFPETEPYRRLDPSPENIIKPAISNVSEYGVVIEVSEAPNVQIKIRPSKQRASTRRRKDTKANRRLLKAAHKLISVTYGTYTEIMDFVEALAWNVYDTENGERYLVMSRNGGSLIETLDGLAKGNYEVDMSAFIVDYAYMQAQDFVISRVSQMATEQAINNLGWTSPVGPSGFVSNTTVT